MPSHNLKNHTAITRLHIRERKEFREKLTEEELQEVSLYFDENNHFINGHTPLSVPKKYDILIVDRYHCKWCNGYHAAIKSSYLCPSNPEYEKNVAANKTKAADYYHNHGRKLAIKNGNNIHKDELVERADKLNEYLKNNPEKLKERNKNQRISLYKNNSAEKLAAIIAKAYQVSRIKKVIKEQERQRQVEYKSHDLFGAMNAIGQIKNSIDNFNSVDFKTESSYDEFSGRRYDNNGDFDPFS